MKGTRLFLAVLVTACFFSREARADFHYVWNDEFTGSGFGGTFSVNPSLLIPTGGPGSLLTINAISASEFFFNRGLFGQQVQFAINGVSPGGILIDPISHQVLSDGYLTFGPSNVITVGLSNYQVLGGRVDFDTNAAVTGIGAEEAILTDTTHGEFLGSVGHWQGITVQDVPAPPGVLLAGSTLAILVVRSRRRWIQRSTA